MVPGAVGPLVALGDPTRARIVRWILSNPDGRARVGELAGALGVTQPTVSHHMKALLGEGIVTRDPQGRTVWYSIHVDRRAQVEDVLGQPGERAADARPRIVDDLAVRFAGRLSRETIADYVDDSLDRLSSASGEVRPSRVARFAAERLEALTRVEATGHRTAPAVLFVCVQNAGRSQLAAALMRQLAGDQVRVHTAGSTPAESVRAGIVTVLEEVGVSLGDDFPKPLTDEMVRAADVVVTMGCGDACPVYPGRRYLDWELDDPVGRPLAEVRAIRDRIDHHVRALLAELG